MRITAVCLLFCVASGVSCSGTPHHMKYNGGMTYEQDGENKLFISKNKDLKFEETVTEKVDEDGSTFKVYNKELVKKTGNRTKITRVTEEEVKDTSYPDGRKIVRTVVLETIDPTNPDKSSSKTVQYEYSPEGSMLDGSDAAATTNNRPTIMTEKDNSAHPDLDLEDFNQGASVQPAGELEIQPLDSKPAAGSYVPDLNGFNPYPNPGNYNGGSPSLYPTGGAPGAGPTQVMPKSDQPDSYQPNFNNFNQYPNAEDYNREKTPVGPTGAAPVAPYPSLPGSGAGSYQPNPAGSNQYPSSGAYNNGGSAQPIGGVSGSYPSETRPAAGSYQPNPVNYNQYPNPGGYNSGRTPNQPTNTVPLAPYPSQPGSGAGPYQPNPAYYNQIPKPGAYNPGRTVYYRR